CLYLDDSGTRNPDRHSNDALPWHGYDWFALGGIIVNESERERMRGLHQALCSTWSIQGPLHSYDIRMKRNGFKILRSLDTAACSRFYADVSALVTDPALTAVACVIDRPGYNARYLEQYGRKR